MNNKKARGLREEIIFVAYSDIAQNKENVKIAKTTPQFKAMYRRKKKNILLEKNRQYPKFKLTKKQQKKENYLWTLKMIEESRNPDRAIKIMKDTIDRLDGYKSSTGDRDLEQYKKHINA